MKPIRHGLSPLVCLSLLVLAGCGDGRPERVPVAGQVLIDGKPLTGGFVRVVPEDARAAQGEIDENGHFRLTTFDGEDGCVPGTHAVCVNAAITLGPERIQWLAPVKYRDTSTSGVTVTVEGPTDDLTIELTWGGGQPFVQKMEGGGDVDPGAG
ncbi:MAG: hypothetical protein HQ581_07755 [Planctomycetes bacterium]|nr:hypothetical protein [Planctomycetota bacterium]